ncbi:hypothetical protein AYO21_02308 [Fonsecaea monophora]|uniref:Ketoreductase domain-containing protein n=1 Tax=Fonsecaea monophora TaxID=254056 RepID=A0A177FHZ5_9EURO|nr:hypothetical protein AYO21_02308 [Fonsecaea monophora]OAG43371.1 hypothetical protein AYO21_02308 [Fonsecaea monophora]
MAAPGIAVQGKTATDAYLHCDVTSLFSLKDRVVVITGGARGIGLTLAFAVAEAGGLVALVDASPAPHEHFEILKQRAARVTYYQSDVTDYERLKSTFDAIVQDYHRIDGIITAAGICPDQPFLDRSPASVKRTFEINVLGTYYAAQLAVRHMTSQRPFDSSSPTSVHPPAAGSVVMIASIAAHQASKLQYTSDYCASKGAVLALCRQLSVELATTGVRVNCISPGYVMTDMTLDISATRPGLAEVFVSEPPMKRMADRTELKGAAVYLLSSASSYMTGGELLITGGMHAGRN